HFPLYALTLTLQTLCLMMSPRWSVKRSVKAHSHFPSLRFNLAGWWSTEIGLEFFAADGTIESMGRCKRADGTRKGGPCVSLMARRCPCSLFGRLGRLITRGRSLPHGPCGSMATTMRGQNRGHSKTAGDENWIPKG